jgi:hypothetical protein
VVHEEGGTIVIQFRDVPMGDDQDNAIAAQPAAIQDPVADMADTNARPETKTPTRGRVATALAAGREEPFNYY